MTLLTLLSPPPQTNLSSADTGSGADTASVGISDIETAAAAEVATLLVADADTATATDASGGTLITMTAYAPMAFLAFF
jgi:hypothetical protein